MNIGRFTMPQGYNHGFSQAEGETFSQFNARLHGFSTSSNVESPFLTHDPLRRSSSSSNRSVTLLLSKINNEIDLNQIDWRHCGFPKDQRTGGNQGQAKKSDCLNKTYSEKPTLSSKIKKILQSFFLPCVR